MGTRVIEARFDDIDGSERNVTSVRFAYDGTQYVIDLGPKNKKRFDAALSEFIEHAKRESSSRGRGARRSAARTDKAQLQSMRDWARKNGYEVADRGRISREIQDAYHAAS